jgi:segregation and condensation protein A
MLLPPDEEVSSEELEDPRRELVQRLLEYQAFKEAALSLREKEHEWLKIFQRDPLSDEDEEDIYLSDVNLFDLLDAFKKMLETAPPEVGSITKETLTVKDKMNFIMDTLEGQEAVRFEDLFKGCITKSLVIVTFIALLELIRLGLMRAYQEKEFGNIWVIRQNVEHTVNLTENDESISQ